MDNGKVRIRFKGSEQMTEYHGQVVFYRFEIKEIIKEQADYLLGTFPQWFEVQKEGTPEAITGSVSVQQKPEIPPVEIVRVRKIHKK